MIIPRQGNLKKVPLRPPQSSKQSSLKYHPTTTSVFNPKSRLVALQRQLVRLIGNPTIHEARHEAQHRIPSALTCESSAVQESTPEPRPNPPAPETAVGGPQANDSRSATSNAAKATDMMWQGLLPTLIDDYMVYVAESTAKTVQPAPSLIEQTCYSAPMCTAIKSTRVLCLYMEHFAQIEIRTCKCRTVQQALVRNGLFPTSPLLTRMAISIDLLHFYASLFERSCDAVTAMAHALNTFYLRRGYRLLNRSGHLIQEPFRKGLGYASQWCEVLQVRVEERLQQALSESDDIANRLCSPAITDSSSSECHRALRNLCPACFSLPSYGRDFTSGADFLIATDGNFHHRHATRAGTGIPIQDPKHIIPKTFVDKVGEDIERARKNKPRQATEPCQQSHKAANPDTRGTSTGKAKYDDNGLMSLVCRHDIPLFFTNIDTPGEQQKYAVALIMWFFKHVPANATVVVQYDIGCVLHKSIQLYDIFPSELAARLRFTTTAMHAYGHRWTCQLQFNPRFREGLGLSDGEGVERVWSRLRKLIVLVRASTRARRIFITDRFIDFVARDGRDRLGHWIRRRLKYAQDRKANAAAGVASSGKSKTFLGAQWKKQRTEQLAELTSDSITTLERDIKTIVLLEQKAENFELAIATTSQLLSGKAPSSKNKNKSDRKDISGLNRTSQLLSTQIKTLYASLQIDGVFPKLKMIDSNFVQILLRAHVLKIAVRKQATEVFFEMDRLKESYKGKNLALGTKLHQSIRKSITKHTSSVLANVTKFNAHCETLKELYKQKYKVTLPGPLPCNMEGLRQHRSLMEDVCTNTTCSNDPAAAWMADPSTKAGIQSLLLFQRCEEELKRLELECSNMCRWFGRELRAAEIALLLSENNAGLHALITRHRDCLLHLKHSWANELVGEASYNAHIVSAAQLVDSLNGENSMGVFGQQSRQRERNENVEAVFNLEGDFDSEEDGTLEYGEVHREESDTEDSDDGIEEGIEADDDSETEEGMDDDYRMEDYEARREGSDEVVNFNDGTTYDDADNVQAAHMDVAHGGTDPSHYMAGDGDALRFAHDTCLEDQRREYGPQQPRYESAVSLVLSFNPDLMPRTYDVYFPTYVCRQMAGSSNLLFVASPQAPCQPYILPGTPTYPIYNQPSLSGMFSDSFVGSRAHLLQQLCIKGDDPYTSDLARECTIFPVCRVPQMRQDMAALQYCAMHVDYWGKDKWILPFRHSNNGNWALCIAYPKYGVVRLFDHSIKGFEGQTTNVNYLQDISTFFTMLVHLVDTKHRQDMTFIKNVEWVVYPVVDHGLHIHDNGLWVLLCIAAVLRGYHAADATAMTSSFASIWHQFLDTLSSLTG